MQSAPWSREGWRENRRSKQKTSRTFFAGPSIRFCFQLCVTFICLAVEPLPHVHPSSIYPANCTSLPQVPCAGRAPAEWRIHTREPVPESLPAPHLPARGPRHPRFFSTFLLTYNIPLLFPYLMVSCSSLLFPSLRRRVIEFCSEAVRHSCCVFASACVCLGCLPFPRSSLFCGGSQSFIPRP